MVLNLCGFVTHWGKEGNWAAQVLGWHSCMCMQLHSCKKEDFGVRILSGLSTQKGTEGLKQHEITPPKSFGHLQKLLAQRRKAFGVWSRVPSDSPRLPNALKVDQVFCASSLGESAKLSRAHSSHSAYTLTTPFLEHWEQAAWWRREENGCLSDGPAYMHVRAAPLTQDKREAFGVSLNESLRWASQGKFSIIITFNNVIFKMKEYFTNCCG